MSAEQFAGQFEAMDRQAVLCEVNGHRSTFPEVAGYTREQLSAAQVYIERSGWLVFNQNGGDGIPFRMLQWTRDRNKELRWEGSPERGELIPFPA